MVPENTKINIINNIKTSMEMENQNLSANDISLLNDFADNKISMEDAMQSIKQFYKKFSKNVNNFIYHFSFYIERILLCTNLKIPFIAIKALMC